MDTILNTIARNLARILKRDGEELDLSCSFLQLGVNSVLGVDLVNLLAEELGIDLGVEAIFDYRGPRELAEYIAGRLKDAPPATLPNDSGGREMIGIIVEEIARMLKTDPEALDVSESFLRLGINSVLGVDLINRLNERLGLCLGVEAIFDYRSPTELAAHVQSQTTEPPVIERESPSQPRQRDIAIVGISARFAEAESVDAFWHILADGRCAVQPVEREGFARMTFAGGNRAGLLGSADLFDPLFFNISPKEAERMDPQQRLLLEECYKALEDSGDAPGSLVGQAVGVFVGARGMDYQELALTAEGIKPQTFLGNDMSILSGRVAYFLDLKGPVVTIDTACSSSLAALHLACESIRRGESVSALAAGVFVMPSSRFFVMASSIDMLSPTGACRAFDENADGMVVAEGVAALFLKNARDIDAADHVYGVIKGSVMNHSGRTQGITAPSSLWQQRMLETAYREAGIDPATVGYVEAQGGGTKLGDPIELTALSAAFRSFTGKRQFCAVGSHKSNIGHAMAAAGMAGVCKVLMAVKYRALPPSIGIDEVNRHIHLADGPFYINRELRVWEPEPGHPLRAGVTAFGFNGTNCHVIIEEGPHLKPPIADAPVLVLMPLSAPTESGLKRRIAGLADWLETEGDRHILVEIAATLQLGRDHFPHRAAFIAADSAELARKLRSAATMTREQGKNILPEAQCRSLLSEAGSQASSDKNRLNGILSRLADHYTAGGALAWSFLYPGGRPKKIALPPYPFERQRYWIGNDSASAAESLLERAIDRERQPLMDDLLPDKLHEALGQLQRLTEWSLLDAYRRMGALTIAGETFGVTELQERLRIISRYDRLYRAHLAILRRAGFVAFDGNSVTVLGAVEDEALREGLAALPTLRREAYDIYPSVRPYVKLLGVCIDKYPDILTGATPATEVMFPGYSMDLMEDIYRGNPAADYYNTLTAWSVRSFIEARLPLLPAGGKIGIVEIGAGTGGTSKPVFAAIKEYAQYLDYYYTDISLGFTKYGRKQYGGDNPYVRFQLLDIEKDVTGQGFVPNGYDMVIATNVFHATRDIRRTLGRTKLLLKKNGWVVANELTGVLDVFTVNFGLLEGWWLFEDQELRLPDSPLLDTFSWRRALSDLGYQRVAVLGQPVDERRFIPQNVIIGESDGVCKQEWTAAAATMQPSIVHNREKTGMKGESKARVRDEIIRRLVRTLGIREGDIQSNRPFSEYGVDSIIGVELIGEINSSLGVSLKTTDLFDYGTVDELSDAVVQRFGFALELDIAAEEPLLTEAPVDVEPEVAAAGVGDIAVIGLACRFAGAADAEEFWSNLSSGVCSIVEIPGDRWDWRRYYDPDPDNLEKTNSKWGGFLEDIDRFDPLFFNISGKEAELSDPQQRLLLEECYHALEDAGYSGRSPEHARCGVFVGVITGDYLDKMDRDGVSLDAQSFWGTASSITAARISYFLNLKGPSVAIDTACSSSLVALHLACQSILSGECGMVISGGVFVTVTQRFYVLTANSGMLSPTGNCRPFDDGADGFVPGEGVGVVVLKALPTALRDNDHIYGLIKASGINQDGRTNGITAPSSLSQSDLEMSVYRKAGISAATISYVEAHGTGTRLGDPIEVEALTRAFRTFTSNKGFCVLGSVKANVGHASAAAGVAGVIKVLLAMVHGKIPPNINFDRANSHIDLTGSPFYVNTRTLDWRPGGPFPKRGTVSAFGFSGTNAHVLLEEAPSIAVREVGIAGPHIVVLSARNKDRLTRVAANMKDYLARGLEAASGQDSDVEAGVALLQREILSLTADLLTIDASAVDPGESLQEAGLDRLGLTELFAALHHRFGVELRPHDLGEFPSVSDLAMEIHELRCNRDRDGFATRTPDIAAIAFTLQVGREHMTERLALVVNDAEQLLQKLRCFLDEERDLPGVFTGSAQEQRGKMDFLLEGDDGREIVERLASKRRFEKLARLWCSGEDIDWLALYPQKRPGRVSLPLYPFARNRYWYSMPEKKGSLALGIRTGHPLIDTVRLSHSLDGKLTFAKIIRSHDAIIADHRVRDAAILPGVGYLELALASGGMLENNGYCGLNGVVWLRPLKIDGELPETEITVDVSRFDGAIGFEISSVNGGKPELHARGTIVASSERPVRANLDLDQIKERCPRVMERDELYAFFQSLGIDYGPFFKGLERVWGNGTEALGELSLPVARDGEQSNYILHPGLADSALQTILTITGAAVMPFALEALRVSNPLSGRLLAYARKEGDNRFNVAIAAPDGAVCATFHDLAVRPPAKSVAPFYYAPVWLPLKPPSLEPKNGEESRLVLIVGTADSEPLGRALAERHRHDAVHRLYTGDVSSFMDDPLLRQLGRHPLIYFLGIAAMTEGDDIWQLFEECQENGVMALFRLTRALCSAGYHRIPLELKIVTNNVFRLNREGAGEVIPFMASLHGLARSMAAEYCDWRVDCIDVDIHELLSAASATFPRGEGEWALRKGRLWRRALSPVQLPASGIPPFTSGGVYFIVGGAGGIGMELALHQARTAGANVVLTGRGALTEPVKEKISRIEAAGGRALYVQADAADFESMKRAAAVARERFGKIDGVVHSAIVLQDRLLENMDENTMRAALVPKTDGSVVLYRVFKDEALDFMLFFSSAQSFIGNKGQANYAAACTFKDAFAHFLAARLPFPVRVINWGYWGSVGIVSSPEYRRRLAELGAYSIDPAEGMVAVERVLGSSESQIVPIKASRSLLERMGVIGESEAGDVDIPDIQDALATGIEAQDIERTYGQVDRYARLSLLKTFQGLGLFTKVGEEHSREAMIDRLAILPSYHRLLDALLDILEKSKFITKKEARVAVAPVAVDAKTAEELRGLAEMKARLLQEIPQFAAHIQLLDHCLASYPEALRGSRGHMEVLFPGGSRELVEGIYKGNIVIDFYNRLVAASVAQYVAERSARKPEGRVAILEVGAGTGGTTGFVLEALAGFEHAITYYYTDISSGFTRAAEKRFGATYPFMVFKPLDIERDPRQQGFEPDSVDLMLGSNVLHATGDMNRTLRHVGCLLKKHGWVVINEITKLWDFATVTFGLTDGWWLYEDTVNRIEGSPLIDSRVWRDLLAANGFTGVRWFGVPGMEEALQEQCVFIAKFAGDRARTQDASPAPAFRAASSIVSSSREAFVAAKPDSSAGLQKGVENFIKQVFARVLRIDSSVIDSDATFENYGVDSLVNLELGRELGAFFGKLPVTLLFEHKTIATLAGYLAGQFPEQAADAAGIPRKTAEPEPARKRLPAVSEKELFAISKELIIDVFTSILKIQARDLDGSSTFETFGVDSLVSLEINKALSGTFGSLPATLLFEHKTIDALAGYFASERQAVLRDMAGGERPVETGEAAIEGLFDLPVPNSAPAAKITGAAHNGGQIAIIGVTGRYPQAADLQQFWDNLRSGKDCIGPIPADRPALLNVPGVARGGFIDEVDRFDPLFFAISPAEARTMDPQERLFLETVWILLEESGVTANRLSGGGRRTGVFAGVMNNDYDRFGAVCHYSSIANRVSYFFDFQGPSVAVDTSCSSSLTAVHLACESLRAGECDAAVAGGVNLVLHPSHFHLLKEKRMLSESGACLSFNAGGDGFVVGEGVGAVLLKPLDRAERDGDRIWAAVKGSAVNAGGKTGGYMLPNPTAQKNLVEEALARSGVAADSIGYIEAQATGSPIADAIEFAGLTNAFASCGEGRNRCALGSVKANIGHLESASGIAGLTKVLLQLRYRKLLPTIHSHPVHRDIDIEHSPFYLQRELGDWNSAIPRRAGVSSFGAGGANAHIIVEEYTSGRPDSAASLHQAGPHVIVLSARDRDALQVYAANMAAYLKHATRVDNGGAGVEYTLPNIAYTLQVGRQAMRYRLAFAAETVEEVIGELEAFGGDGKGLSSLLTGDSGYDAPTPMEAEINGSPRRLARAWVEGQTIDWSLPAGTPAPRKVLLPTYPFRKKRYWIGEAVDDHVPEQAVAAATAARPLRRIEEGDIGAAIVAVVSAVLEIGASEFDRSAPFTDFGVDSVSAVTIIQRLNGRLSLQLRDTDLFNYPSIEKLTRHIASLGQPAQPMSMVDLFRKLQNGELTAQQTEQLLESQTW